MPSDPEQQAEGVSNPEQQADSLLHTRPTLGQILLWIALAACASILLVSITNHLSQNVAPIPLLWVLPLALYLLTFILAFESDRLYQRWIFLPWLAPALAWMAHSIYTDSGNLHIKLLIPIYSAGLFVCCMMCHGELAMRKPAPRYLTLFYLMVSLGGAIGGIFVAFIAPRVFNIFLELQIGLVAAAILAAIVLWTAPMPKLAVWPARVGLLAAVGYLGWYLGNSEYKEQKGYVFKGRNFYGVLHVRDDDNGDDYALRSLLHGTINHGSQLLRETNRYLTTSYYSENSGVGRAIRAIQERGPIRYGSIGLGAGVLSNYARAQDYVRIYEINPLVEKIAQTQFSFFPHSPADKMIVMGDARLSLEAQEPQNFDLISVDAFSSDAIPIHLLTREAFQVYFRQLKPDGILALHISNRYLNLAPVCAAGAAFMHKSAQTVTDEGGAEYLNSSTWVLVTGNDAWFSAPSFQGAVMEVPKVPDNFRAWTDDYSNIVQILSLK